MLKDQIETVAQDQTDVQRVTKTLNQQTRKLDEAANALKQKQEEIDQIKKTWVPPNVLTKEK